jgi:hypothetical protein
MEHLLELYHKPYNPRRPMVCFDEKSLQLLAHLTAPLPLQPGHALHQDYEYKRNGTRNLFVLVEPRVGFRQVLVPQRRTKQCLARRLPDEWTLTTQILAWEETRNAKKASIRWNFTVADARIVFKEHYPTPLIC